LSDISDLIRNSIKQITPYSPGKSSREVKEELGLAEVVKLASNENPLGPCPQAIQAMQQAAAEVYFYPDPLCQDLTAALADKLDVDPDGILVGRGSDEIIHMMGLAFVNPGEEIIYSDPWFAMYPITAALMDARAVTIRHRDFTHDLAAMAAARDFTHDLAAMAAAITDRTKLVFISNPYNPTGTIVTAQQVSEFMSAIPDYVIVGFDEAYYEYVDDPDYPNCLDYVREGRKAVVLRTFSKAYGLAGLRIGYGIAPPELATALKQVREPFNVSSIAQVAALASLADPDQVQRSFQLVQDGKQYLYEQFEQMGLSYVPTQANFVFVDVGIDSRKCFDELMQRGVTVRTGDIFGTPTHIRVTIGTMEQNRKFIEALRDVLNG